MSNLSSIFEYLNASNLITWFVSTLGPFALVGVCLVVFAETGLLAGFFLPGDSLLFMLGVFVGSHVVKVPLCLVLVLIPICAILGVQSGYWIGRISGEKIFNKKDSKFFKKKYVNNVKNFYKKHGASAVFFSQYIPIMRTFSPVAAGVGKMNYKKFFIYNVFASLTWGIGFPLLGFALGNNEFVKTNIDKITILIVLVSVLPIIIKGILEKKKAK
jgi:membrane-associated protein